MLPFLKNKLEASVSAPVTPVRREPDEEPEYDSLHSAAEDLMNAVHAKNIPAIAEAFKAAFELCEMSPHEEAEHAAD